MHFNDAKIIKGKGLMNPGVQIAGHLEGACVGEFSVWLDVGYIRILFFVYGVRGA